MATTPQVTAADIHQWVVKQLPIGTVGSPQATSLVNLKTVLWLNVPSTREWGPLTIIQAGVRIRASLVSVDWDFGDGQHLSTDSAGEPYDRARPCDAACAAYFGHAYTATTGAVTVRAQSWWRAEFSVDNGPFVALPAPVEAIAAPALTVTIRQAHTELVSGAK